MTAAPRHWHVRIARGLLAASALASVVFFALEASFAPNVSAGVFWWWRGAVPVALLVALGTELAAWRLRLTGHRGALWTGALMAMVGPYSGVLLGWGPQRILLARAQRRGAFIVEAVRAFQRDHRALPATLEELVPGYVKTLPQPGLLFQDRFVWITDNGAPRPPVEGRLVIYPWEGPRLEREPPRAWLLVTRDNWIFLDYRGVEIGADGKIRPAP